MYASAKATRALAGIARDVGNWGRSGHVTEGRPGRLVTHSARQRRRTPSEPPFDRKGKHDRIVPCAEFQDRIEPH
jgi:hypothetical protein